MLHDILIVVIKLSSKHKECLAQLYPKVLELSLNFISDIWHEQEKVLVTSLLRYFFYHLFSFYSESALVFNSV